MKNKDITIEQKNSFAINTIYILYGKDIKRILRPIISQVFNAWIPTYHIDEQITIYFSDKRTKISTL